MDKNFLKTNKVFFDCEFTGLHKNTSLISIGLVHEDGTTFYGEFLDYDKTQVDSWIQENVIDNLILSDKERVVKIEPIILGNKSIICNGNKDDIRSLLIAWLDQFESNIEFVSDVCHYDMVLLVDLLAKTAIDLPDNFGATCHDINQDIARFENINNNDAFNVNREEFLLKFNKKEDGKKHCSLYDAKVIKHIYNAINDFNGRK